VQCRGHALVQLCPFPSVNLRHRPAALRATALFATSAKARARLPIEDSTPVAPVLNIQALTLLAMTCAMSCMASAATLTVQVNGSDGKPLADAVVGVLVRGQRSSAPASSTLPPGQIAQRDRQFQPFILPVQTGTPVLFPNFDTVRHQVYSFSAAKRFELKLYSGTTAAPVVFDKAGPAALGCNIHDRMTAWVVVMDTPLLARTNAQGQALFELPAGEHRIQAWHAALPEAAGYAEQGLSMGPGAQRATVALPTLARP
jgi:plastocyanin